MNIVDILIFVSSLANFVIAISVIPKSKTNKYIIAFFLSVLGTSFWGLSTLVLNYYTNMFWERFLFTSSILAVFFIATYSFYYSKINIRIINIVRGTYLTITLILLWSTNLFIEYVAKYDNSSGIEVGLGKLFSVIIFVIIIELIILFFNLFTGLSRSKAIERQRLKYFIFGIIFFVVPTLITNLLLPVLKVYSFNNLGIVFSLFFTTMTMISIVRFRLFSIETVIAKILSSFTLGLVFWAIVLILRIIKFYVLGYNQFDIQAIFIDLIFSIIVASLVGRLSNFLQYGYSSFLKSEILSLEKMFTKIFEEVKNKVQIDELIVSLTKIIENGMENVSAKFYDIYDYENTGGRREYEWLEKLRMNSDIIILQEEKDKQLVEIMRSKNIDIIAKLSEYTFLTLSSVNDRDSFTKIEIEMVEEITSLLKPIFLRIDNERMIVDLNTSLQKRVDEATSKIQKQLTQLKDAREKERNMIDIMGHELRTPATIANLNADLLAKYWRELLPYIKHPQKTAEEIEDRYIKYMARLKEGIVREIKLINVLLVSAKIDGGKIVLNKEAVDISNVIQTSIHAHERDAKIKGLSLRYANAEDESNIEKEIDAQDLDIIGDFGIPKIYADKTRIFEVVDNLITNAIKYTEEGEVTVSVESDEEKVEVTVKDTGVGISEADLKKIGQKFYRVGQYTDNGDDEDTDTVSAQKSNGKYKLVRPGGTGLGLYVAFGLVKEHGGQVKIKSKLGVGSEFSFSIGIYKREYKRNGSGDNGSKDMFKKFGLGKK